MIHRVIDRMKREMDEQDISIVEMSRRLRKASASGLYQIFNGKKSPTLKTLDSVARSLGLEIAARRIENGNGRKSA